MQDNITEIKTQADLNKHLSGITRFKKATIDTETTSLDPYSGVMVLFGIGDADRQYVIHSYNVNISPLKDFLESDSCIKIFHNHKFDYKYIKHHCGIEVDKKIFDTMLAELVLIGGGNEYGKVSLAAVVKKYFNKTLSKEARSFFPKWMPGIQIPQTQIKYLANDLIYPFLIEQIQTPLLKQHNLTFTAKLEFAVSSAIADMELNGMPINKGMWMDIAGTVKKEAEKSKLILNNYFSKVCSVNLFNEPDINYDSPQQLLNAMNKLGYKIKDTSNDVLKSLPKDDVIKSLITYRGWTKAYSTYGPAFLDYVNPKTDRIHTDFWQILNTGRMSSSKPNLQNIKAPRTKDDLNFREPFQVEDTENERIITADYSGCELRFLADFSKDPILLDAFNEERFTNKEADVHSKVASLMHGVEVSKRKNKHLRDRAKNLNFGLIYGMGHNKLAAELGIPSSEAKSLIDQYFKTMPGVKDYLAESSYQSVQNAVSITAGGRKRFYNVPNLKEMLMNYEVSEEDLKKYGNKYEAIKRKHDAIIAHIQRQGKNAPIQGSNGDTIKLALVNLRKFIKEKDLSIKLINTVHDENVLQGNKDYIENYKDSIVKIMEDAEAYFLKHVPPRVDYVIHTSWSK